ncbi:Gfo/Idh/MocA family protein [Streptomyces cyanogenus]|uniref:UDP-kanosamine synthase oxidoreductase subunit n=1 Tax=Streptomyces cyanogenus TaxID=80860 RepID=A0ABX7THJ1_STRCY|nr:Gfo/Idh/MocA family oxidoreductase [Streptomyces cyanogenus]QTD95914.1 Putative UDP-kanosamine synthase oxidoreductase subunit [Streptomyces cyanogenus]
MTGGLEGAAAEPLRIAMVGLGWAGSSIWLPRLRRHPRYTVSAVVDPAPQAPGVLAAEGIDAPLFTDAGRLPPDLADLAVVAVPNHLHAAVATGLLARGTPVFLEKPVCLSSAEARQLTAAERAGGTVLLAGSAARYRADVAVLREAVGSLGRIRHVDLEWVRARGVPNGNGWFTRASLAGGGALLDLGWHLLDTLTSLLGPVRFDQAVGTVSGDFVNQGAARADWRAEEPSPGGPGNVEDTARAFLVTDEGVSVTLRAAWASHRATDVTRIRVDGSDGSAALECTFGFSPNRVARPRVTRTTDGVTTELPVPAEEIGAEYARQLDELPGLLADSALRGRAAEDAARAIGVIERIYRSAHKAHTAPALVPSPERQR